MYYTVRIYSVFRSRRLIWVGRMRSLSLGCCTSTRSSRAKWDSSSSSPNSDPKPTATASRRRMSRVVHQLAHRRATCVYEYLGLRRLTTRPLTSLYFWTHQPMIWVKPTTRQCPSSLLLCLPAHMRSRWYTALTLLCLLFASKHTIFHYAYDSKNSNSNHFFFSDRAVSAAPSARSTQREPHCEE